RDLPALRTPKSGHSSPRAPPELEPLDDRRDALPKADAHRLEPVALARPLQLVKQGRHQLGARATEGMAERDRPTVDVHPAHGRAILPLPRQDARPERRVDL